MNDSDSDEKKPEDLPESAENSAASEEPSEPPFPKEAEEAGLVPKLEEPQQEELPLEESSEEPKPDAPSDEATDKAAAEAFDEAFDHDDYDYDEDHDYDPYSDEDPYEVDEQENKEPFQSIETIANNLEQKLDGGRKRLGSDGGEMSFLEHLEDLRGTLFKSLMAFLIMGGLMIPIFPFIADILQWPLARAYGAYDGIQQSLITTKPFEVFSVFIQMIFMSALGLSLPFILYFVAQFIAPGLTDKEKSVLRPGLMTSFFLFLSGVAITYFLVLPLALYVLIQWNQKFGFEQMWTAGEYYSMVVWLCLGVGAIFQFPLVLVLLCYVGILSTEMLRSSRRIVVVVVLVVAALITPGGDPLTLMLLALPLYGLFEGSIVVAQILEKKQRAELEKADAE